MEKVEIQILRVVVEKIDVVIVQKMGTLRSSDTLKMLMPVST
jgi:hypothetical protein